MGIKRLLVAGGIASLVLIGVVLVVDAKSMASIAQASDQSRVDKWTSKVDSPQERQQYMDKAQNSRDTAVSTWKNMRNGGTTGGTTGGGTNGSATTGGGTNGSATTGGGTDGSATTGAAGSDMETVSFEVLPDTGGSSVVLLLTSALLLGSGLLMVVFVRSVRS